jgi:hypothetical protein
LAGAPEHPVLKMRLSLPMPSVRAGFQFFNKLLPVIGLIVLLIRTGRRCFFGIVGHFRTLELSARDLATEERIKWRIVRPPRTQDTK